MTTAESTIRVARCRQHNGDEKNLSRPWWELTHQLVSFEFASRGAAKRLICHRLYAGNRAILTSFLEAMRACSGNHRAVSAFIGD
jgi:hypothetical protein